MTADRLVVVLCGPPGAGKTTAARDSGLAVFDRDDPKWHSERHFTGALSELRNDRHARAVVIRRGSTSSARATARQLMLATHVFVLVEPLRVLETRIRDRNRADKVQTLSGLRKWFREFDRLDGVQDFPGWVAVLDERSFTPTSEAWL